MKRLLLFTVIICFSSFITQAQVGINTQTPEESLHVAGTLRVENTTSVQPTKILGRDDKGTVATIQLGTNVNITNNTLISSGSSDYGIINHGIVATTPGTQFDNIDLDLNGANTYAVVFRLTGASSSFEFTGIEGGTDGRHIVLLNVTVENFKLIHEDSSSDPENRIWTLGNSFEATSGRGAMELVYDGVLERWLIINVRN